MLNTSNWLNMSRTHAMYERVTDVGLCLYTSLRLLCVRELDLLSITYRSKKKRGKVLNSYAPKRVIKNPAKYCFCGNTKASECDKCVICSSDRMRLIQQSVTDCTVNSSLKNILHEAM